MQCKDIPERPVLEFLIKASTDWTIATWFWDRYGYKPENSVVNAMPEGVTGKLALAKMKSMIRKGLVDGCPCGCRGDFIITSKGREVLGP